MTELSSGHKFPVKLPARLPYRPQYDVYTRETTQLSSRVLLSQVVFLLRTDKGNKYVLVKKDDLSKDRLVMLFAQSYRKFVQH